MMDASSIAEKLTEEWGGSVVRLLVENPKYSEAEAMVHRMTDGGDKAVVWVLESASEIKVNFDKVHRVPYYGKEAFVRKKTKRAASGATCSICLEPVPDGGSAKLPCGHEFCCTCLLGWFDKEGTCCPNCRSSLPDLLATLKERTGALAKQFFEMTTCRDQRCCKRRITFIQDQGFFEQLPALSSVGQLDSFLQNFERFIHGVRRLADDKKTKAKPHHRDLIRKAVCYFVPALIQLRKDLAACQQLRILSGEFDRKIDDLYLDVYGKTYKDIEMARPKNLPAVAPMGTPEESRRNAKMGMAMIKLIAEDIDTAWTSVLLFSEHYLRILHGFGNACQPCAKDSVGRYLREKHAMEWILGRLDELDSHVDPEDDIERHTLLQFLTNFVFACSDDVDQNRFIRVYGQESILRERDGGLSPSVRHFADDLLKRLPHYQDDSWAGTHNLLHLRPCSICKTVGSFPGCLGKERAPNTFLRCDCGRRAYCSHRCALMEYRLHRANCQKALQARKTTRHEPSQCASFEAGTRVLIHSLKNATELNGHRGTIIKVDPDRSRVKVDDSDRTVDIRLGNLRIIE